MSKKLRFRVVETAFQKETGCRWQPLRNVRRNIIAKYVFNKEKMFKYLPSKCICQTD